MVYTGGFDVSTRGETDIIDVTGRVEEELGKSGFHNGTATVFVSGATASVTTIEYEDGLLQDLADAYERIAPRGGSYAHNERWGDGNGYAHIRASMTGQDFTVPFSAGRLMLGTWQQIVLIDFDNRPRKRTVTVQITGE